MLQISTRQMAELRRGRREAFVRAQPRRLGERFPDVYAETFPDTAVALAFVEELVTAASAAGVTDRADIETLLDTCLMAGWISPRARAAAGIDALLVDSAPAGPEKVTRIVNAAAFAAASRLDRA